MDCSSPNWTRASMHALPWMLQCFSDLLPWYRYSAALLELTGWCLMQVVASSCDAAVAASLAHGLQRSFQEAGRGRQRRCQEVHGGQWAAAGGKCHRGYRSTDTPVRKTHPDGAWWIICQIVPARNHLQASLSCSFLLLHISESGVFIGLDDKYNGAN